MRLTNNVGKYRYLKALIKIPLFCLHMNFMVYDSKIKTINKEINEVLNLKL